MFNVKAILGNMAAMAAVSCLLLVSSVMAAPGAKDWANWRGPNYDGSSAESNLPSKLDDSTLKWKLSLTGPAAATPIVVGDHIFLTVADFDREELLGLCVDRKTGGLKWSKALGSGYQANGDGEKVRLDNRSNYASPSPVSDGEIVVFTFGNGDMVATDFDGKELWRHNLQKKYGDFSYQWTYSASPTIYEGLVFLPVLQRDAPAHGRGKNGNESYILALNPKDGSEVYRHVRPSDAKMESLESFSTIIPYQDPKTGRKEIIVKGGDVLTGHDPKTGKELWRWGTWNPGHRQQWWRVVPTPTVGGGVVIASAPKKAPVFAVPLGQSGNLAQEASSWNSGQKSPVTSDSPSAAYANGHFYFLSDMHDRKKGGLFKLDPKTGKPLWSVNLQSRPLYRASPTVADGKIYIMNHAGEVRVFNTEDGKQISKQMLGKNGDDLIRSTVAVAHGTVFVRTNSELMAFGK